MATTVVVESPNGAHPLNQLLYVRTRDDAIPYRGVFVPTIANSETGAALGVCVGCKHMFGSLWVLSVVVQGVVTYVTAENTAVNSYYSNGLLNIGNSRAYVSPEKIAPLPPLR